MQAQQRANGQVNPKTAAGLRSSGQKGVSTGGSMGSGTVKGLKGKRRP